MALMQRMSTTNLVLARVCTNYEKTARLIYLTIAMNASSVRGSDHRVYVRGETEMLENGKVRVRPIVTRACWSFEELHRELQEGLKHRRTATSTVHDQSSRTHAILNWKSSLKTFLMRVTMWLNSNLSLSPLENMQQMYISRSNIVR